MWTSRVRDIIAKPFLFWGHCGFGLGTTLDLNSSPSLFTITRTIWQEIYDEIAATRRVAGRLEGTKKPTQLEVGLAIHRDLFYRPSVLSVADHSTTALSKNYSYRLKPCNNFVDPREHQRMKGSTSRLYADWSFFSEIAHSYQNTRSVTTMQNQDELSSDRKD